MKKLEWDNAQWTETESALYLCLSPKTLRKWRSLGKGPSYQQLGRSIRYTKADLDAWAKANSVTPGSIGPDGGRGGGTSGGTGGSYKGRKDPGSSRPGGKAQLAMAI